MILFAATLFGIGKSYFWPTMLGITADRFPKGGPLALGVLSAGGMFSVGFLVTPIMGTIQDHYAVVKLSEISPAVFRKVGRDNGEGLNEKKVLALSEEVERNVVSEAKAYSAAMTFRWVAVLPALLTVIFGFLFFHFRFTGGYRVVRLE
jgi:MFS family permease